MYGNNLKVVFVGEAPGYNETVHDTPFIGESGALLREVLEELGYQEDEVGFTNVCLCRPPHNRTPTAGEMQSCSGGLLAELKQLNPKLIVALGATPMAALFGKKKKGITARRGLVDDTVIGIKGLATYHPSFILRSEVAFPEFQDDLALAKELVEGTQDALGDVLRDHHTSIVVPTSVFDARELVTELTNLPTTITIAYDWETTALSPRDGKGFCLGLSWAVGKAVILPMWAVEGAHQELVALFNSKHFIGAFNATFDGSWNDAYGLNPRMDFDPLIMHYMLDERPQQRSLERLTMRFFRADPYESDMLAKYGTDKAEMTKVVPADVIYHYCGRDADYTLRLQQYLGKELARFPSVQHCYDELVMPALRVFRVIHERGVQVDTERLAQLTTTYENKVESLRKEIEIITGTEGFNPRSPQQVAAYLWDVLQLEQPVYYGRTDRSVDKATREALMEVYGELPILVKLSEYSAAHTILTRYLVGLGKFIGEDNRVRAQYHFDRTETGRLSTTDPAIHQIPRDSDIRTIFVAGKGRTLVQADYAQIEMRMAAHIAEDDVLASNLMAADFHRKMAAEAFRVPYDLVTKEQRQAAKAVSFGLLYGMGEQSLARKTGLPPSEAHAFITRYKELTFNVQKWIAYIKRQVQETGVVQSVFGRRRRFWVITRNNVADLQREAINMPIQSSASDLTLWAATELEYEFAAQGLNAGVVIMVHDSLVVECDESIALRVAALMKLVMEDPPFNTKVRFPVDIKIGKSWGVGEEFKC